jgi:hypothetical protein
MKTKILGLLALGLLAGPVAAQSIRVTVNGERWDLSTVVGSFKDHQELLMSQPWWGKRDEGDTVRAFITAAVVAEPRPPTLPVPWPCILVPTVQQVQSGDAYRSVNFAEFEIAPDDVKRLYWGDLDAIKTGECFFEPPDNPSYHPQHGYISLETGPNGEDLQILRYFPYYKARDDVTTWVVSVRVPDQAP